MPGVHEGGPGPADTMNTPTQTSRGPGLKVSVTTRKVKGLMPSAGLVLSPRDVALGKTATVPLRPIQASHEGGKGQLAGVSGAPSRVASSGVCEQAKHIPRNTQGPALPSNVDQNGHSSPGIILVRGKSVAQISLCLIVL